MQLEVIFWTRALWVFPLRRQNTAIILIEKLGKNDSFMLAARNYVEETLICAELVKLMPKSLAP